jgi:3D (Asp-Asp-Asp) domain-containing protein
MQTAWMRQSRALFLLCGSVVALGTLGMERAQAQVLPIREIKVTERVETLPLNAPERRENRTDLPSGTMKVVSPGEPGTELRTYQEIWVDGKVVSEKLLTAIRTEPKPKVIYLGVGSKGRPGSTTVASRSYTRAGRTIKAAAPVIAGQTNAQDLADLGFGAERWPLSTPQRVYGQIAGWSLQGGKELTVNSTAYTPDAGLSNPSFRTSTGRPARMGMVAVDPRVIPMNSLLYVEGYGWAVAADTGGVIKGQKIDVCLGSRSDALQWGRRKVRIIVFPRLVTQDLPSRSRRG